MSLLPIFLRLDRRPCLVVGAGTDAHRVASYNPFTALQQFAEGNIARGEALRLYTLGSAWFSHDDAERGSLEPGKLADLAVLTAERVWAKADVGVSVQVIR